MGEQAGDNLAATIRHISSSITCWEFPYTGTEEPSQNSAGPATAHGPSISAPATHASGDLRASDIDSALDRCPR
jgi:hypothetical protein